MRVVEKKIKADSGRVQETERDQRTRKERRKNRETEAESETAITNATDEIAVLRDPSITADQNCSRFRTTC